MVPKFIGREIKVTVSGDYGFGMSQLRRTKWWQRHHRNYYRVKTTQGEVFEIYYDRGTKLEHPERKKWFLYRQL